MAFRSSRPTTIIKTDDEKSASDGSILLFLCAFFRALRILCICICIMFHGMEYPGPTTVVVSDELVS
jgi:hypothetical protein